MPYRPGIDGLLHLCLLEDMLINTAFFSSGRGHGFKFLYHSVDSNCCYESIRAGMRDEANLPPMFQTFHRRSFMLLVITFISVHNSCQFEETNRGKSDFYISQHKLGYAVVTNNPLLSIFLAHATCPEALLCVTFI